MNLIVNVSLGGEVVELEQLTPKEYELVRRECVRQFLELARKKRKTKEDISHLEHWSVFLHRTFSEVFPSHDQQRDTLTVYLLALIPQ